MFLLGFVHLRFSNNSFNEFIVSDTVINIGISILHKIEHKMIEDIMININRGSHKAANDPLIHINGGKLSAVILTPNVHLLQEKLRTF